MSPVDTYEAPRILPAKVAQLNLLAVALLALFAGFAWFFLSPIHRIYWLATAISQHFLNLKREIRDLCLELMADELGRFHHYNWSSEERCF